MTRLEFTDEDRDALIAQKRDERVRSWCLLLAAGDKRATNDLQNLVLERLTEADAKAVFVQAALNPEYGGVLFVSIVAKLMHDECEKLAVQTVDAMEAGRKQSRDENRIDLAEQAAMLH